MTGPLSPPGDTGSPIDFPPTEDIEHNQFGPSVFMADYGFPPPGTVVVPPMPRNEGNSGIIVAVKTAMVQALRDALQGSTIFNKDQANYITLDYPMERIQFPGIWVQFSVSKMNRAGIGHEIVTKVNDKWAFIQEWTFEGRITLTICALKSLDRDRLADALITAMAFARLPDLTLKDPDQDTKKNRTLITALDENPYVALTLQLDTIIPGGQSVSQGTPWGDEAALIYEDSYSFDLVGQFNLQFAQDGIYTLAEIRPNISLFNTGVPYSPPSWLNTPGGSPVNPAQVLGWVNEANTDIPAM